jgi:hypothetical protein
VYSNKKSPDADTGALQMAILLVRFNGKTSGSGRACGETTHHTHGLALLAESHVEHFLCFMNSFRLYEPYSTCQLTGVIWGVDRWLGPIQQVDNSPGLAVK